VERLHSTGTVLGLFETFDCSVVEQRLCPGDALALYTEGATECCNPTGGEFGEQRLVESVRRHRNLSAEASVRAIIDDLKNLTPATRATTLRIAKCRRDEGHL
jgi:serine phosphatase RsbU (regulator of sigma subunit)